MGKNLGPKPENLSVLAFNNKFIFLLNIYIYIYSVTFMVTK